MKRKLNKSAVDQNSELTERELTHLQELVLSESGRKINIQAAGGTEEITMKDVAVRKLFQVAAKGSPHALNLLMRTLEEAERTKAEAAARQVEIGRQIKASLQRRLDRLVEDGADPDLVVPHPDDIVITEGKGYEICGPIDEQELDSVRKIQKLMGALLHQYALEQRMPCDEFSCDDDVDEATGSFPGASSMVEALLWNTRLPERFRTKEAKLFDEGERLATYHTKRELLKMTYAKWREAGHPKPRGYMSPSLETTIRIYEAVPEAIELAGESSCWKINGKKAVAEVLLDLARNAAFR